jgi:ribosomal protein S18 acetylase RimI-like enzyme
MGIRPAEPSDLAAVEEIVGKAYTPWIAVMGTKPMPMVADYERLIADDRVSVLENGEIDAIIVLIPEQDGLLVDNVAVRPDRQGRGLGRRLMTFAEHQARTLGLASLRLYTNEKMVSNIALYTSLGYRETGREVLNGRSVVLMRKVLQL